MSQGNFMKVVDTLEKYQAGMVNSKSESGKEFILFKRQLYQMYEVQNRSIDEHDTFSLKLERQNLRWLYNANLDYIGEVSRVANLDNLVAHGSLKGSIFRAKMMSARRLRGLGYFAVGSMAYMHMASLTLMLGPTLPAVAIAACAVQGARMFNEQQMVSKIDYIKEGELAGLLRMTIQKSPIASYKVVVNPRYTMSLCSVGEDDMGEDDAEGNILYASEYLNETTGEKCRGGYFQVPADSHRDKITMEWIFAQKSEESETDALYNLHVMERHMSLASTGGITGIRALTAQQTGYANFGDEEEIAAQLGARGDGADDILAQMSVEYGQDRLERMKPSEFYRLYKDFSQMKA